ncbi:hydroxysqualene dehydroxylase HpnE [Ramlibacter tataouinensis]|uniref:Amine oxidase domain-containing protein n=1 Tax=Ramlibacter tataouinensis (strain ATCC BAA-407 / DSM 14655 / LMG 21543 / TTB310) TaxID=365046 RepID=F5Y5G7_RAMTT|nr:hydroxysqualene dehydroxylase HpnE [Ramlibacter tataouinensis]AEG92663.1 conserved hypothetical protein [Ramlibacter tataouinensis TTB310]
MAQIAVIGAGWAGLAAAVTATQAGHRVSVFEAARTLGGRARSLEVALPEGGTALLDNGQHILIGAYGRTLALMRTVGVEPAQVLHALPLTLRFPDGTGLALPAWPAPLDAAWGIARARGWDARDKASLLRAALRWRLAGFQCAPDQTVLALCDGLAPRVLRELVEPLCVAALNTPAARASGQVFLRVLRDSLFGPGDGAWGSSWLLLPHAPLGELLPQAAARWLAARGQVLATGHRVASLAQDGPSGWRVDGQPFDAVLLACPPWEAQRLLAPLPCAAAWRALAQGLAHEPIATVYASSRRRLPLPLLALRDGPDAPAQYVFDRGQLGGPQGLLAFVASASRGAREAVERQVLAQAHALGWTDVRALQTVVEKRATFACLPGLRRPPVRVAPGLLACGDYVEGPYPATLEGAVRSAEAAAALLP